MRPKYDYELAPGQKIELDTININLRDVNSSDIKCIKIEFSDGIREITLKG